MVLPLKTEIEIESVPAAASIDDPATVRVAKIESLPPPAAMVALVAPLDRVRESLPSAKEILMSFAVDAKTTESLAVSSVPPPKP